MQNYLEHYVMNRQDFKVKVIIKGCLSPQSKQCVEFIREQYNEENELVDSSMYQFFMNESELIRLGNILIQMR